MFNSNSKAKIGIFKALIIGFVLSGCSSTSDLLRDSSMDESAVGDYSIIYYIHADSDYLYHDANGEPVQENNLVLETAFEVAEGAKSGEVFIFYQRPERKLFGLFPRRSSRFYHYSNGILTGRVDYRHSEKKEDFLTTEALLYHQYRIHPQNNAQRTHFLYFGHEIPIDDGKKYHRTLPNIEVNVESFSKGLKKFLGGDGQRFDLVVLSTCNNGSAIVAEHLLMITDVLLASPQNLHLSHIDSGSLRLLELELRVSAAELTQVMADQTYQRLDSQILTAITLTMYDMEVVRQYEEGLQRFTGLYENLNTKKYYSDNIDCNEVDFFDEELFSKGVMTWYKPARFGRRTLTTKHSGWGCRPLIPVTE